MFNRSRRLVVGTPVIAVAVSLVACGSSPTGPPAEAPAAQQPASAPQATTRPATPAAGDPVWHYEGAEGPTHWAALSPKFAACGEGRSQSPIEISNPSPGTAEDVRVRFPPATLRIAHHEHIADGINNGHTIQINYPAADTLSLGQGAYQLVQYHFHAPSEHTVSGKHFPMEMHFVHKAADGKLAVVAVFIEEGPANAAFAPVWANLPARKGVETHLPAVTVDVDALLPASRTSYRYDGSLTTPPCSEGVKWILMTTPIALSSEQIGAFTRLVDNNNRPVQPLNGRTVLTDAVSVTSAH
jgi:carbonic anhydrase